MNRDDGGGGGKDCVWPLTVSSHLEQQLSVHEEDICSSRPMSGRKSSYKLSDDITNQNITGVSYLLHYGHFPTPL